MLVDDLRHRMSAAEYQGWSVYYQRIAQRKELAKQRGGG
jgi:hypothetical protein